MFEKRKYTDNAIPGGIRHYLAWARSKIQLGYKKWDAKRISFVSVLIAISVVFFLISVRIMPVSALPSLKFSFIGLPVKITGFIFGPFVGVITGILADLISFILVPTYYHYLYTIAVAVAGFVPGLCAYYFFNLNEMFFSNKYKIFKFTEIVSFFKKQYNESILKGNSEDIQYFSEVIAYYEVKIILLENKKKQTSMINFAFISAILILVAQIVLILAIFSRLDPSYFEHNRFIKNKLFYLVLTVSGFAGMILAYQPLLLLYGLIIFLVLLAITRMVSLTAMVTITLGVFLSLLFNDWTLTLFALAIDIFIIYRHRSNIQRILNGTENKVPMPWEQKNKDTK